MMKPLGTPGQGLGESVKSVQCYVLVCREKTFSVVASMLPHLIPQFSYNFEYSQWRIRDEIWQRGAGRVT